MPLLDMALSVYGEMHTFDGLGIPAYRADGREPGGGGAVTALVLGERPAEERLGRGT